MSNRHLIFVFVFLVNGLFSQINVKTTLPQEIKIGSEITFDAKIWKGPIKNFSKYQLQLPVGLSVTEVDVKSGSYTIEENLVKIIWAITPPENEFTITLKLNGGNVKGKQIIIHKYYYLEKGEKREVELAPIHINFVESLGQSNGEVAVADTSLPTNATNAVNEELKLQVQQLRKDSKEAQEVGEREKAVATKKLEDANQAVKRAKLIAGEKEKSQALQKAMAAKDKAESDLAMANRILTLAKSLEDNASEIEKLNQSLELVNQTEQKDPIKTDNTKVPDIKTEKTEEVKASLNPEEVEKAKQQALNKGAKDAKGLYKPISVSKGNIKEIIQQVEQIKKDSKEAREVGLKEKRKAEQKLNDAYTSLKAADYINDPEEKKQAIEKANQDKDKAEKDLEVASKILVLAKSLEDNALEIGKLNDVDNYKETVKIAPANTPTVTTTDVPKPVNLFEEEKEPVIPAKETTSKKVKPGAETPVATQSGLVYKLQIGAFTGSPDKSQFAALGKVQVIKEGSMYKAYYGNFASREEAVVKRDQLRAKGLDGFVVIFKDGVKAK